MLTLRRFKQLLIASLSLTRSSLQKISITC